MQKRAQIEIQSENEVIDWRYGKLVAVPSVNYCNDCMYQKDDTFACPQTSDDNQLCSSIHRTDGREIIWIKAKSE